MYRTVPADRALATSYDLVVVGSPRYFDEPIVESLRSAATAVFGPGRAAGALETSKDEFKRFATTNGIPTPKSATFEDFAAARAYVSERRGPFVIKADGPARGCGVAVCSVLDDAEKDLDAKLNDSSSPYYSGRVVIEEFIDGFEVAANVIIDGSHFRILPPTKPHKRRNDGDDGPNVAGMGSVSPLPLNPEFYRVLSERVIQPTLAGLAANNRDFRGCLFLNLMLTDSEMYTLEFNCRMGDPAMLVNLPLLKSNLFELLISTAEGRLDEYKDEYLNRTAVAVTITDRGYPDAPFDRDLGPLSQTLHSRLMGRDDEEGLLSSGLSVDPETGELIVTNGVIATAVGVGNDVASAQRRAYAFCDGLDGLHYRRDIATQLGVPDLFAVTDDVRPA